MINSTDQLISNLWESLVVAAPLIVLGCLVYLHKTILRFEDRELYVDAELTHSDTFFSRRDELPEQSNRTHAMRPTSTVEAPAAHRKNTSKAEHESARKTEHSSIKKTEQPVQPRSEPLGFGDTLGTLFLQRETDLLKKDAGQD